MSAASNASGERPPRRWLIEVGRLAILGAAVAAWHAGVGAGILPRISFSTPAEVAGQVLTWLSDPATLRHVVVTLQEAVLGFTAGALAALALLLSFTVWPLLGQAVAPVLTLLNAVPRMALAPLFIVWFGLGLLPKVVLVATVVFFIVFFNLHKGLTTVSQAVLDHLSVIGAGRLELIRHLYVPALFGWLIAGLRASVGFGFAAAIVAEYLGSTTGLGFLIFFGLSRYSPAEAIAGILLMLVLVVAVDRLVVLVERRFWYWELDRL